MSCSATYFPEVGAGVSLKVTTKVSPKGENNSEISDFSLFLRQKWWSVTQAFETILIKFTSL